MQTLRNKTALITGASRGIGLAIALRFAEAGANIVVLTKDSPENIKSVSDKISNALVLDIDISDSDAIQEAVKLTVERFKGIDILVNNTSASCFTNALNTSPKQFDTVISTSVRAAFLLSQACFPYLKQASNPHIINISPPIHFDARWFKNHLAFSLGKHAMSMCTIGMAEEFREAGIAVNSLWPETTIATQTIKDHFLPEVYSASRWPSIMGDAAYELVKQTTTGRLLTDEEVLRESGIVDFSHYAVDSSVRPMQALFIPAHPDRDEVSKDLFLINKTSN